MIRYPSSAQRHPCGSVAHVLTLSDIAPVTCQRRADHDGSHCARLPGAWQWWNRDGAPPPVEIPMAAYVNGGRPRDWIEPKPTCPVCGGDAAPDGPGCRCYGD